MVEEHPSTAAHTGARMYTVLAQNRNPHTSLILSNAAHTYPFSRSTNKCKDVLETNTTVLEEIHATNDWRKDWEISCFNPTKYKLKTKPLHKCRLFLIYHLKKVYLHHTAARWKATSVWMLCKIKLSMSIFFKRYATKNAVQPDFTETLKCVHFTVMLSRNYFFKNTQYFSCIKVKTTMPHLLVLQS